MLAVEVIRDCFDQHQKGRSAMQRRGLQMPPCVTRPEQREPLHGLGKSLDRQRPQRVDAHRSPHQP